MTIASKKACQHWSKYVAKWHRTILKFQKPFWELDLRDSDFGRIHMCKSGSFWTRVLLDYSWGEECLWPGLVPSLHGGKFLRIWLSTGWASESLTCEDLWMDFAHLGRHPWQVLHMYLQVKTCRGSWVSSLENNRKSGFRFLEKGGESQQCFL